MLSNAWKVLIFFLLTMALQTVFFGVFELTRMESPWLVLFFGVALVGGAEFLRGSRFAGNGSDAAASFWAIAFLLVGFGWLWSETSHDEAAAITLILVATVLLFAAACIRWGFAAYGTFAAVALFGLLGRFPAGRLWWIGGAVLLLALAFRNLDRAALAPPHRRAVAGVFAVAAIALYVALNRVSVDQHWVEALLRARSPEPGPARGLLRVLSTAATALLPPAFLAWGIRTRRTLILDLGLVFAAASLVTLRYYVHLAPLWVLLTLAGAALILGALWVNRLLRRSPAGERSGFTADPLFASGRRAEALQAAAVVAGFTAPAAPVEARGGDLTTGGGRFGGGGSSADF